MLTMSRFHVSLSSLLVLLAAGCAVRPAPDSPRPAPTAQRPATPGTRPPEIASRAEPVELKSLVVRGMTDELRKAAGPGFRGGPGAFVIEVETEKALGDLSVSSAPVIVLNGQRLTDTCALPPNRLRAFVPDRRTLREANSVAVVWVGRSATLTRKPLTFRPSDIRDQQ